VSEIPETPHAPDIVVAPLPAYCPGCGGRIERIGQDVVHPWTVVTCPHCRNPLWRHQLHGDGRRARSARGRAAGRRRGRED